MQRWSKQKGLDIDKAPFFTENSIKDIVGLNFNPGVVQANVGQKVAFLTPP